jgi:hypothetical protein
MDLRVGHHDLTFFKDPLEFQPFGLRWVVSKRKENIVGHKK